MQKALARLDLRFCNEYFLFLLPCFFVLHGFVEHYGRIPVEDASILLLKYLLSAVVLVVLFIIPFRSFRKACLYSFTVLGFYLFFGSLHDWLRALLPGSALAKYSFVVPVSFILLFLFFIWLYRTKRRFNDLVKYLNMVLVVLLLVELVQLVRAEPMGESIIQAETIDHPLAKSLQPCDTCAKEDIHLIVADEYAGAIALKEVFGFDNTPFLNALRERGFHVNEKTVSNYNSTVISMASLLSMNYPGGLSGMPENDADLTAKSIIRDNVFIRFLRDNGYEVNNFSIFDLDSTAAANNRYNPPPVVLLTGQTFLSRLSDDLSFHLYSNWKWQPAINRQRKRVIEAATKNLNIIDSLVQKIRTSSSSRPQFYYTHLLMPHKPYYFVKQGKIIGTPPLFPSSQLSEKEAYLEYLQFTNRKILSFIDSVTSVSSRPPVIILMSDHGLRDKNVPPKYHFMNLNAVLFPDRRYNGFYKGISNVNQLRVLLNSRFNQTLPMFHDSTIFLNWEGITGP